MDEMLRDHTYAEELEQLKTKDEADEDERAADEGESGVSMDGLEMIKRLFQYKRWQGDGPASGDPSDPSSSGEAEGEDCVPSEPGVAAPKTPVIEPADMRVQAGCTAVVAVKYGNDLFVANAGDSRGVLCRSGQAVALSEDHKPAAETERNRILNAGELLASTQHILCILSVNKQAARHTAWCIETAGKDANCISPTFHSEASGYLLTSSYLINTLSSCCHHQCCIRPLFTSMSNIHQPAAMSVCCRWFLE